MLTMVQAKDWVSLTDKTNESLTICWNMVQEWSHIRFEYLWQTSKKSRDIWPQFLQTHRIILGEFFCVFAGVAGSSESISGYSLQLPIAICFMPLWKIRFCPMWLFCHVYLFFVIICFTHVTFLKSQSINCLMLCRKLAVAWDFSLYYLSPPFAQDSLSIDLWEAILKV